MHADVHNLEGSVQHRWRILNIVDQGGMGAIYRGEHTVLNVPVAIKVILPAFAQNADALERFVREARIGATMVHTNLARTLDMFSDDAQRHFIVMDWLDGEDLRARLQRGPCHRAEAQRIFNGVCAGLITAHREGVVHRDIKPANIFLARTPDGIVPKLLDFGVSKLHATSRSGPTRTNMAIGTPAYMSLEQFINARDVTQQSDIYSLAVVLYEMLTGNNPFRADNLLEVLTKVKDVRLPPHPHVAPPLMDVLLRATAEHPEQRPPSVRALQAAVAAAWRASDAITSLLHDDADVEGETKLMRRPARPTPMGGDTAPLPKPVVVQPTVEQTPLSHSGSTGDSSPWPPAHLTTQLTACVAILAVAAALSYATSMNQWLSRTLTAMAAEAALSLWLLSSMLMFVTLIALRLVGLRRAAASKAAYAIVPLATLAGVSGFSLLGELWARLGSLLSGDSWRLPAMRREVYELLYGGHLVWLGAVALGAAALWALAQWRDSPLPSTASRTS